jgi:hypothetical protein
MSRTVIAAVAALAIALIVPAAASAQYSPPFSYPTAVTLPYPPVSGLEVHPFGFGGNWAANSPLEADFAEYIAWRSIESDYRMRAATYDDLTYYSDSGLIGTTFSSPASGGVNWYVRIVRYVPPASERLGHYCVYEGFVNGPVLTANQNVFTQIGRSCGNYLLTIEGSPSQAPQQQQGAPQQQG